MRQARFEELLRRYLNGECTPAEENEVEEWYQKLDENLPAWQRPRIGTDLKEMLWHRIQAKIRTTGARAETPPVLRQLWQPGAARWAAAAVLAAGVGLAALLPRPAPVATSPLIRSPAAPRWLTHTNTTARPRQLALTDGSTVTLQPNSTLRYPQVFAGNRREVHLRGEAFFQVARNPAKPFQVLSEQLTTTVLGTSFTVRAYPGQRQGLVMVRTGRVRVSPQCATSGGTQPLAAPIELLPNQQVACSADSRTLRKELVENPALLVARSFVFDDRPVAEVIQALEQAYGVPIVYDEAALAGCTVRIIFQNEPMFRKLDLLCKALGASYERDGAQVVFRSKGCASKPPARS